jgi:CRP/FNR family transcriptional regulator, cyclic AMP receptor protein
MTNHESELLDGLASDDVASIVGLGRPIALASGSSLFRLGDDADQLFTIRRGRLALMLPMRVGPQDQEIVIEERAPGQTVGWSALIPPHRFTLSAVALIETEVLALPRTALLEFFSANPAAGYVVTRNVAAVIGQRLQVFQAMWLREMQRVVKLSYA